jgi:hypothetical protein
VRLLIDRPSVLPLVDAHFMFAPGSAAQKAGWPGRRISF